MKMFTVCIAILPVELFNDDKVILFPTIEQVGFYINVDEFWRVGH